MTLISSLRKVTDFSVVMTLHELLRTVCETKQKSVYPDKEVRKFCMEGIVIVEK